ncbi:CvpA family protein [Candidatus Falkowbacteria bacterium]|nr:CvpA family protein [Candidatus Falkowbacteria bacterium]
MTIFDSILLVLLGSFVLYGLWFGTVHTLGSLIGTIVGTIVASWANEFIASIVAMFLGDSANVYLITYLLILFTVSRLIKFLFTLAGLATSLVTRLPFLSQIDKVIGGALGFVMGMFVMGLGLVVLGNYDISYLRIADFQVSRVGTWIITASSLLIPLLPKSLQEVKTLIGF